ncbi:MAG: hypothetical protein J6N52_00180 [Clostridia bacterium]|nr:hypothetical protein [Clostridia bacterium]
MKKRGIAMFLVGVLTTLMFSIAVAADSNTVYTELNFDDTVLTNLSYGIGTTQTTLVVKGKTESGEWEQIDNSNKNLKFKSMFPTADVSQIGVVTAITSGTAQIIATYQNPDGTFCSKSISVLIRHYDNDKVIYNFENETEAKENAGRNGSKGLVSNELSGNFNAYASALGATLCEMWFYDNMETHAGGILCSNDATASDKRKWNMTVGVDTSISQDCYYLKDTKIPVSEQATKIKRSKGWHQVVFDATRYNTLNVFIDGISVYSADVTGLVSQTMSLLRGLKTEGTDVMYYDDWSVYKATDGRPVAYNVTVENEVCDKIFKASGIDAEFTAGYEFYAATRTEDAQASRYRFINAANNIPYDWNACSSDKTITGTVPGFDQKQGFKLMVQPSSVATSSDYKQGPQITTDPITIAWIGEPVRRDVTFLGESNGHFRNISADGIAGEKKVRVVCKALNTGFGYTYTETLIAALYENDVMTDAKIGALSAERNKVGTVTFDFEINNPDTAQIRVFRWKNTETLIPLDNVTSFDAVGIR